MDTSGFHAGGVLPHTRRNPNELPHLTEEECRFAEEHHDLLLRFLLGKNLSFCDHYDIVVFGYLRAVHRYHIDECLRRYSFSTVAWKAMNGALSNYRRNLLRRKRFGETVSLIGENGSEIPARYIAASFVYDPMEELKVKLLLHDLASVISKQQMEMVRMRLDGMSIRQIAKRQKLTLKQVQAHLKTACTALKQLCYET